VPVDGVEVRAASLTNGLLRIDLARHVPEAAIRQIEIGSKTRPRPEA